MITMIMIINFITGESKAAFLQAPRAARQAQAVLDPPASLSSQTPTLKDLPLSNSNQIQAQNTSHSSRQEKDLVPSSLCFNRKLSRR